MSPEYADASKNWGGRVRTCNFPGNSRAVCQLTYAPSVHLHKTKPPAGVLRRAVRFPGLRIPGTRQPERLVAFRLPLRLVFPVASIMKTRYVGARRGVKGMLTGS